MISDPILRQITFLFFMPFLMALTGSLVTAVFFVAGVTVMLGTKEVGPQQIATTVIQTYFSEKSLLALPALFLVVLLSSLIHGPLKEGLLMAGSYLQFLFVMPLAAVIWLNARHIDHTVVFSRGARLALIAALPFALYQVTLEFRQPEGFSGNPLIFGTLILGLLAFAVVTREDESKAWKLLAVIGGIFGAGTALLTFSRAVYITLVPMTFVLVHYYFAPGSGRSLPYRSIVAGLVFFVLLIAGVLSTESGYRQLEKQFVDPIENIMIGNVADESISARSDMFLTGWEAFKNAPFSGYGLQNVIGAANSVSLDTLGRETSYGFTHLHNDYLTHAVGGGIVLFLVFSFVLIVLPLRVAFKAHVLAGGERHLLYSVVLFVTAYSVMALGNMVFRHDLTSTFFALMLVVVISRLLAAKSKNSLLKDSADQHNVDNDFPLLPDMAKVFRADNREIARLMSSKLT